MKSLRKFEEFLKLKIVRKQKPDIERAKSLVLESDDKMKFFDKVREKLAEETSPNYSVEACYDVLIEFVRAKLLLDGYKTDSHEAEISYMRNLGFSEGDVEFMNQLRYFRNGIKYYGRIFDDEYAEKVVEFTRIIYPKLRRFFD